MATIFISHSSKDDALASDLETWLRANGFSDLFVDHSTIRPGERWADALRASASTCRVVACLVTERWLASVECPSEFRVAWYMGKRIAPLYLIDDEHALPEASMATLARVRAESQGLDLTPFRTEAGRLDFFRDSARADLLREDLRAAGAMAEVGLDPAAFEIDKVLRPSPFPGLSSFGDNDADAAIFYGRSREIGEALENLRSMRVAAGKRVFLILGASGAGKSSFLRAGLIPRLRREIPAWLPIRSFRPGLSPLQNFSDAISRTFQEFGVNEPTGSITDFLMDRASQAAHVEALDVIAGRLREASGRPGATLLLSVDQAEELMRVDEVSSIQRNDLLPGFLRAATRSADNWVTAFAIRSDSFAEMQADNRFEGLEFRGYDLRSMPVYRLPEVIEGPAWRYGISVEPQVVDKIMSDAPSSDALPLIAFTLERLFSAHGGAGAIRATDYDGSGASTFIEKAIDAAVLAASQDQRISKNINDIDSIVRELFIPHLVTMVDVPMRRVSLASELTPVQRLVADHFVEQRLLTKGLASSGAATLEIAHEALLRAWKQLANWVHEENSNLALLGQVEEASRLWEASGYNNDQLIHRGKLAEQSAEFLRSERYRRAMTETAVRYLQSCGSAGVGRKGSRGRPPSDANYIYNAFISYSHSDSATATSVYNSLVEWEAQGEARQVLAGRGISARPFKRVFRDTRAMPPGGVLDQKLVLALRSSEKLIVICSPRASLSEWVNKEVETFEQYRGREHVVPVWIDGAFSKNSETSSCLPRCWLDTADPPLAIDARDADRSIETTIALVSALLGLPRRLIAPSVSEAASSLVSKVNSIRLLSIAIALGILSIIGILVSN